MGTDCARVQLAGKLQNESWRFYSLGSAFSKMCSRCTDCIHIWLTLALRFHHCVVSSCPESQRQVQWHHSLSCKLTNTGCGVAERYHPVQSSPISSHYRQVSASSVTDSLCSWLSSGKTLGELSPGPQVQHGCTQHSSMSDNRKKKTRKENIWPTLVSRHSQALSRCHFKPSA